MSKKNKTAGYRDVDLGVAQKSPIRFKCSGKAGEIVRVRVRVATSFRGCRFETEDDFEGVGTMVDLHIEGRSCFPEVVASACFSSKVMNNLLSMPRCAAGGTITVYVHFLSDGKWSGKLHRRAPGKDAKYVDGTLLLQSLSVPVIPPRATRQQIGAIALCDERAVKRVYEGNEAVRPLTRKAVTEAAKKLGVEVPK